jgi:hypothetical protein
MHEYKQKITESISKAIASIDSLQGVKLLEGLRWFENVTRWVIKCRITIESPNKDLIPNETDWYILLEGNYPRGEVELIPAKQNGITKTFQHQYYNGKGEACFPWRKGIICARTTMFWLNRKGYDIEPFEPENRLGWNIKQAIQWLLDAAKDNLVNDNELFELPDYSTYNKPYTIAFCESQETLKIWVPFCNSIQMGFVELGLLKGHADIFLTVSFKNHENQILYQPAWNENIIDLKRKTIIGTWILAPRIPVLPPWQAPMTWGELIDAVGIRGEHYDKLNEHSHFILIGFLIPKKIGQMPNQIHWQALSQPILKKTGSLLRYLDVIYSSLDWQKSENWHSNEIFNRGMYSMNITESKIVIIGGGAFGSIVAEMLVRGGAKEIILVDHEKVEIGNLTRHTLALEDIGVYKAKALERHLANISPNVKVKGIINKFENVNEKHIEGIKNTDIVIDCSGSDDVLHYIEQFPWANSPLFFSISIGLNARRLYVLVSKRRKFPGVFFQERVRKWLDRDVEEYGETDLPRSGGIGCWHPAFSARCDEMWLWAATSLKYFTGYAQSDVKYTKVAIFEQEQIGNFFGGVKLVEECHDR